MSPLPNNPLLHNLGPLNDVITLQTHDGLTRYLIIGCIVAFVPWSGSPFMLPETSIRTTNASSVNSMGIYSGIVPLTNAPVVITIVDGVRKLAHNWLSIDRIVPNRWKQLPLLFNQQNDDWEKQLLQQHDEGWIEIPLDA